MRVLFVCTGNTCRSPMAEAYLRSLRPAWTVESAGLSARLGLPASAQGQAVAAQAGLSLEAHRSRPLKGQDLEGYDAVLGMTEAHFQGLRRLTQGQTQHGSVDHLGRYLDGGVGVADPYGGDLEEYRRAFAEIRSAVDGWLADQDS